MKAHMQIANTIWKQLTTGMANKMRVGSWGSHGLMGMKQEGTLGTLRFKVNGSKFKGYVYISLNGMDMYDIDFVKIKRKKDVELSKLYGRTKYEETAETVHQLKNIFCDQMTTLIDNYVKKQENYVY